MANPQRLRRVADQIQRELSELLRAELKDPRVGMITLTGVEVSPDLGYANVFFTTLADAESLKEIETGLARAAGFLRVQRAGVPRFSHLVDLLHVLQRPVGADAERLVQQQGRVGHCGFFCSALSIRRESRSPRSTDSS